MPRSTPPTKIAKVVSSGRYMPTENSMGERTLISTSEMPIAMPTITSGQAISPPTMPWEIAAISPACGAGSRGPPEAPLPGGAPPPRPRRRRRPPRAAEAAVLGEGRQVGGVQQVEREEQDEAGDHDAD